jgi:phosphohistidine phosphatase
MVSTGAPQLRTLSQSNQFVSASKRVIMRRLSLLRHAEAAHTAAGSLDRHRTLTEPGRLTARALGVFLDRENLLPDLILSSDALRATDTAHLLQSGGEPFCPVSVLEGLYNADPNQILGLLREHADDAASHVMVVGHNPSIGVLAQELAGGESASGSAAGALRHFEPATCAVFAVSALEWQSFLPSHAELRRVMKPAEYTAADS